MERRLVRVLECDGNSHGDGTGAGCLVDAVSPAHAARRRYLRISVAMTGIERLCPACPKKRLALPSSPMSPPSHDATDAPARSRDRQAGGLHPAAAPTAAAPQHHAPSRRAPTIDARLVRYVHYRDTQLLYSLCVSGSAGRHHDLRCQLHLTTST